MPVRKGTLYEQLQASRFESLLVDSERIRVEAIPLADPTATGLSIQLERRSCPHTQLTKHANISYMGLEIGYLGAPSSHGLFLVSPLKLNF
jgi:hypothetical protein